MLLRKYRDRLARLERSFFLPAATGGYHVPVMYLLAGKSPEVSDVPMLIA